MRCAWCDRDVRCWTFRYYAVSHRGTDYLGSSGGMKDFSERFVVSGHQDVHLCRRDTLLGLALTLTGLHLYAIVVVGLVWLASRVTVAAGVVWLARLVADMGISPNDLGLVAGILAFFWMVRGFTRDDPLGVALLREAGDRLAIAVVTRKWPPGRVGRMQGYMTRYEHSRLAPQGDPARGRGTRT